MKYAVAAVVLVLLTALFSAVKIRDVGQFRGDTAIFFQTTENIAHGHGPRSQVFANTQAMQQSRLMTMTAAEIRRDPLTPPAVDERNLLRFHAYYALYPLALLTYLIPVNVLLLTLYVLSFIGLLVLAYMALRGQGVAIAVALLFCWLVASQPAWMQGLLWGQFFPDRFFLAAGFALALAITRPEPRRGWQLAAAFACALVGERGALYAGGFTLLYLLLFWRSGITDRTFKVAVGATLVLAGFIMLTFGISNPEYGSFLPSTIGEAIGLWQNPAFSSKALVFIAVSLPMLALAFLDYRAGAIAALLMLPNLFGNIGGAEKIGWSTHYHEYYFPFLVWAAAQGLVAFLRRNVNWGRLPAIYPILAACLVFVSIVDPDQAPLRLSVANLSNNVLVAAPRAALANLGPAGSLALQTADALSAAVPPGAVVSTTETGMPFLYQGRTIRFFPVGIDSADYAVVGAIQNPNGTFSYSGAVNFLGPLELSKVDAVLTARMKRDGYDLDHPMYFAPLGAAVLKRGR